MSEKILVTYASRTGSTAGVAIAIGKTLLENGLLTEVLPMQEVKDFSQYSEVVTGTAIIEGDHRIWDAIRSWAQNLKEKL